MWRSVCSAAASLSSWSRSLIWKLARLPHLRLKQLQTRWQKLPGKPVLPAHPVLHGTVSEKLWRS